MTHLSSYALCKHLLQGTESCICSIAFIERLNTELSLLRVMTVLLKRQSDGEAPSRISAVTHFRGESTSAIVWRLSKVWRGPEQANNVEVHTRIPWGTRRRCSPDEVTPPRRGDGAVAEGSKAQVARVGWIRAVVKWAPTTLLGKQTAPHKGRRYRWQHSRHRIRRHYTPRVCLVHEKRSDQPSRIQDSGTPRERFEDSDVAPAWRRHRSAPEDWGVFFLGNFGVLSGIICLGPERERGISLPPPPASTVFYPHPKCIRFSVQKTFQTKLDTFPIKLDTLLCKFDPFEIKLNAFQVEARFFHDALETRLGYILKQKLKNELCTENWLQLTQCKSFCLSLSLLPPVIF